MFRVHQKFQNVYRPNAERGASLLEGIAYLGIAAIVILGAVSLLTNAFGSAQSNQTANELVSLRTAVKKLYAGQPYGAADLTATLRSANAFPSTLTVASNPLAVTNSWGGAVLVTGAGARFTISYAAIPRDVCVNTVSGATGWTSVGPDGGTAVTAFPISPTDAGTICSAATNTVVFTAS